MSGDKVGRGLRGFIYSQPGALTQLPHPPPLPSQAAQCSSPGPRSPCDVEKVPTPP